MNTKYILASFTLRPKCKAKCCISLRCTYLHSENVLCVTESLYKCHGAPVMSDD